MRKWNPFRLSFFYRGLLDVHSRYNEKHSEWSIPEKLVFKRPGQHRTLAGARHPSLVQAGLAGGVRARGRCPGRAEGGIPPARRGSWATLLLIFKNLIWNFPPKLKYIFGKGYSKFTATMVQLAWRQNFKPELSLMPDVEAALDFRWLDPGFEVEVDKPRKLCDRPRKSSVKSNIFEITFNPFFR